MAALGAALRYRGLAVRALAAWATPRLSALPHVLLPPAEATTAGALLELFVAGRTLPVDRLHALDLDALHRAKLVDVVAGEARARVAVLPLGGSLLVCDRLDAPAERELACWPDDSSYHLALSLPSRLPASARWLDLGCGSAFAQLYRPELAYERVGADLNERALAYAKLGGELSDVALATHRSDLGETVPPGPYELVTCNAPIPHATSDPYRPIWRESNVDFVARLFDHASRLVAPRGLVVIHAAEDALEPVLAELPGERVTVAYTPLGVRGFAVAWWRPDAEARLVATRRELTAQRPHVTFADYEATAR